MKALVTDGVHEVLIEDLEKAGIQCTYLPKIDQDEVEALIPAYEILIINSKIKVDARFIDQASKLRIVGRLGSGLEIVDLDYAASKGIQVFNSPEGNRDAVAEHAIGMLLSLFNQLNFAHQDVINFNWQREARRGEELKHKKIALIGFGNTGKAIAQKLSGFEVSCFFYDKYLEHENHPHANQVDVAFIQANADIVSIHLPYNKETHHWFNEELINGFTKPIYLINTSRGKIVNTGDLLAAIENGSVKGACLDVFENENIATYTIQEKTVINALAATNKVQFSTHIAGWTNQSKYKLGKILAEKIVKSL